MEIDKETEKKIGQLQLMEQNIQNVLVQKQSFQTQELEINNALEELKNSKGMVYKIIGGIMISSEKNNIKKDLESKKEIIDLRIKNIEKQENLLKDKLSKLQEEVKENIGNKKNG